MTFSLPKHDAIHRARVRKDLRAFASSLALTSRLAAACLLLAGFLGVGSVMAQATTTVLRLGGGPVTLTLQDDAMMPLQVHHFIPGTADPVMNPTMVPAAVGGTIGAPATTAFPIGSYAHAVLNTDVRPNILTITPIATGSFKILLTPDGQAKLSDAVNKDNDIGHLYVVMSANAPMVKSAGTGAGYNAAVATPSAVALTRRDATSKEVEMMVSGLFDDPDDVSLNYTTPPASVERTNADNEKELVTIATATVSDDKLTIALTDKAMDNDEVTLSLIATDAAGEYAWKHYRVTVGAPRNPYVTDGGIADKTYREGGDGGTIDLSTGFADPELALDTNNSHDVADDDGNGARALDISVKISDASAERLPATGADFTWITTPMNIEVTGDGGAAPMVKITPRTAGMITFTVTATDKGAICRVGDGKDKEALIQDSDGPGNLYVLIDKDNRVQTNPAATGDMAPVKCWADALAPDPNDATTMSRNGEVEASETTGLYPDSKNTMTTFTVKIDTRTTPSVTTTPIKTVTLVADKDVAGKTVDLADVDVETAGAQPAFNDHKVTGGLTYTVELAQEKLKVGGQDVMRDVAMATVSDEGVITITPSWRTLPHATVEATVTAMNNLDETAETTFDVTVNAAQKPVVNPLLVETLGDTLSVMTGTKLEVDLKDVSKLVAGGAPIAIPLFIDPDADPKDVLPLGLQLNMSPEDVVTAHRYDDQSTDNDVYTSAGRITLDTQTGILTLYATAPNHMTVTVHGADRDINKVMASMVLKVVGPTSAEVEELPTEVGLSQNYPNPFNPQTTIEYALPEAGDVSLIVYDMLGREVTTLLNGPQTAGRHAVNFDAAHLSNGTYVYRLVAPKKTITRTMVLVK